ncbi:unnamed protein product, partial [Medioppia subpectinata]
MRSSLVFLFVISIIFHINPTKCEEEDLAGSAPPEDTTTPDTTTTPADDTTPTDATTSGDDTTPADASTTTTASTSQSTVSTTTASSSTTPKSDQNGVVEEEVPAEKLTLKEKYQKLKKKANIYVREKAKKLMDILNFDISKLDVRNLTQFLPFYDGYRKLFNKKYANEAEKEERMSFFKRSVEKIKEHNRNMKAKYMKGINEMSDMSFSEILKQKLGFKQDGGDVMVKASAPVPEVADMPKEWDWRKFGILTPPRNQGKCGSCWSFAASCVLESHNMKRQIAEGKFDPKTQITV